MRRHHLSLALAAGLLASGEAAATIDAAPAGQSFEQAYVTGNVNVRTGPGTRHPTVNRLTRGDFVNVGACEGSWCYVDVYGGSGWVSGRFIGRGRNPYHDLGPAGPGIPPQEPGTVR